MLACDWPVYLPCCHNDPDESSTKDDGLKDEYTNAWMDVWMGNLDKSRLTSRNNVDGCVHKRALYF